MPAAGSLKDCKYWEGLKVLCYHHSLIYEAKIQKAEIWTPDDNPARKSGPHYFVHYKGWKDSRWDEWVSEDRILEITPENIARQKQLSDAHRAREAAEKAAQSAAVKDHGGGTGHGGGSGGHKGGKKGSVGGSGGANAATAGIGGPAGSEGTGARGTKRGRESLVEQQEEAYLKRPALHFPIPDPLKLQLVDDWENVTHKQQLVPLPRKPNVQDILRQYLETILKAKPSPPAHRSENLTREFLAGLQLYFEKSLPNNLLYKFERLQHSQEKEKKQKERVNNNNKPDDKSNKSDSKSDSKFGDTNGRGAGGGGEEIELSKIYGAEHLLRLFVNLPEMIAHTSMDTETTLVLKDYLTDFLRWMEKEKSNLFLESYEDVKEGSSYLRDSSAFA